jgi:pyruvate dehydrogenase E2 component (dihydrolipoamide acetyltransferase)
LITPIVLPTLRDTVSDAVILKWLKQEGSAVLAGEILVEIEFDKAIVELETPGGGILRKIFVAEGERAAAGRILAIVAEPEEDISAFLAAMPMDPIMPDLTPNPGTETDGGLALSNMRAIIARRMTMSKATAPHFYLGMEIDMGNAAEFKKSYNETHDDFKISYNDLVVKACALALVRHTLVNSSFIAERIVQHRHIDVGIAVALHEGLITPIVRNCEEKTLTQIAQEIRQLARRAKKRALLPEEYSNATFTVTNLGMFGIEEFSGIINPPAATLLAAGAVVEKPVVHKGQIVIGHRMKVVLSCDHRVIDGAAGALFLREFKKILEEPFTSMK